MATTVGIGETYDKPRDNYVTKFNRTVSSRASLFTSGRSDACCEKVTRRGFIFPLFCLVFFSIWYGICSYVIYYGNSQLEQGNQYAAESTTEQCVLQSYSSSQCSYQCNCKTKNGKRSCDTCYGLKYSYTATVEAKCGSLVLTSSDFSLESCPQDLKEMNIEYTCYVLGCDDAEFSFDSPDLVTAGGTVIIVIGSLFMACPCCFICCFFCLKCG